MHHDSSIDLPGIEIEFLWADRDDELHQDWDTLLPGSERERRAAFGSERRRRTFTMGRVAARRLAARKLGLSPEDVPLIVADSGAVDIEGYRGYLSITHTDDAAAAVISDGPVGVDMEPVEVRIADLYKYVLSEDEYPILDNSGLDHNSTTLLCWVVKEAVLKGLRTGLRRSPRDLTLSIDFERGNARVFVAGGETWICNYSQISDNYIAVAVPE